MGGAGGGGIIHKRGETKTEKIDLSVLVKKVGKLEIDPFFSPAEDAAGYWIQRALNNEVLEGVLGKKGRFTDFNKNDFHFTIDSTVLSDSIRSQYYSGKFAKTKSRFSKEPKYELYIKDCVIEYEFGYEVDQDG